MSLGISCSKLENKDTLTQSILAFSSPVRGGIPEPLFSSPEPKTAVQKMASTPDNSQNNLFNASTQLSFFSQESKDSVVAKNMSFNEDDVYVCQECGAKMLMWDSVEHQDFHLAQSLQNSEKDLQLKQRIRDCGLKQAPKVVKKFKKKKR